MTRPGPAPSAPRPNPEQIGPIIGRVVAEIKEQYPTFLEDPVVASVWGEVVNP